MLVKLPDGSYIEANAVVGLELVWGEWSADRYNIEIYVSPEMGGVSWFVDLDSDVTPEKAKELMGVMAAQINASKDS